MLVDTVAEVRVGAIAAGYRAVEWLLLLLLRALDAGHWTLDTGRW